MDVLTTPASEGHARLGSVFVIHEALTGLECAEIDGHTRDAIREVDSVAATLRLMPFTFQKRLPHDTPLKGRE